MEFWMTFHIFWVMSSSQKERFVHDFSEFAGRAQPPTSLNQLYLLWMWRFLNIYLYLVPRSCLKQKPAPMVKTDPNHVVTDGFQKPVFIVVIDIYRHIDLFMNGSLYRSSKASSSFLRIPLRMCIKGELNPGYLSWTKNFRNWWTPHGTPSLISVMSKVHLSTWHAIVTVIGVTMTDALFPGPRHALLPSGMCRIWLQPVLGSSSAPLTSRGGASYIPSPPLASLFVMMFGHPNLQEK